ncbi:MAG TPA: hypothetical protein VG272_05660 [Candidatus Acidoferrales bacterium]|jgi:hypothetical protein|nr:hypothetical protein [Candidatus Acidoferrales bacterium]
MRKLTILCVALFCLSLTASAQDSPAAFDTASPASEAVPAPAPAPLLPSDRDPWQVGLGFQYLQFNVLGVRFHDFAYKVDGTRYLNNWFGVEGAVIAGFGHVEGAPKVDAKSLFLGGGPHISVYNSRHLEPWVHALVGWEHLRFTQGATLGADSHAAFYAGGGVDYKISATRLFWRVQGDYIGTNFGPKLSTNYAFGTGVVINF